MKKLRMELDTLAVESFTTAAVRGTGTVLAASVAPTAPECSQIDGCHTVFTCVKDPGEQ